MKADEKKEKLDIIDEIVRTFENKAGIAPPPRRPEDKDPSWWERTTNKLWGESDQ